jgi:hypothetical protein
MFRGRRRGACGNLAEKFAVHIKRELATTGKPIFLTVAGFDD